MQRRRRRRRKLIVSDGGIASGDDDDQEEAVIVCGGASASRDFVPTVSPPTYARKSKADLREKRQQHRANCNKPHALNSDIRKKLEHVRKSKVVRSLPLQIEDARVDGRDVAGSSKKRKVEH